jgi:pimeloyl-ACP methyl ester carboxylesterase
VPDVNVPDFEHLRPSAAIAHVLDLVGSRPTVLAGSSLGGLMALQAAGSSSAVRSLVVLCPALEADVRWAAALGPDLERWRRDGRRFFFNYVTRTERPVDFGFYEDLMKVARPPAPRVPVRLIHGRHDEVVPCELSLHFQRENADRVRLTVVEDDHGLLKSVELVVQSVLDAVGEVQAEAGPET